MSAETSVTTLVVAPTGVSTALQRVQEGEDAVAGAPNTELTGTFINMLTDAVANAAGDITQPSVEDASSKQSQLTSSELWAQQKKKMGRLDAAIKAALAVSESESEHADLADSFANDRRSIKISIDEPLGFLVPWKACQTWRCMEAFFREWFSDNEEALKHIADGNYILSSKYRGLIHPSIWDSVVEPDLHVDFSRQLPSETANPRHTQSNEPTEVKETKYENKIQYKIKYYRRRSFSERAEFLRETAYEKSVEFEVADEFEKLPALEERKDITFGSNSTERSITDDDSHLKPPILRQSDALGDATLKIHSPYLLNILKSVIEYSADRPAGDNKGLDAGLVEYPYKDLYYHLEDLQEYRAGALDLRARHSTDFNAHADEHIDLLTGFLEDYPAIGFKEARSRWEKPVPVTTFASYWLLMKPGTDVYVKEKDGSLSRYVLDKLSGGVSESKGKRVIQKYIAELWDLRKATQDIWQYSRRVDIPVFDDERKIVDLAVFPARFQDESDGGALRQKLLDRGKKYFYYSKKPIFLQYSGQGLRPGLKSYNRARVVVEHASSPWDDDDWGTELDRFRYHVPDDEDIGGNIRMARCECKQCNNAATTSHGSYPPTKFSDYDQIDPAKTQELTEHQYLLLPSHMYAFILKDRSYDLLDVANLDVPSMAVAAIDRLVIQPGNKEIIKAVAKTYTESSKRFSADFIYGKGEGQIILLHGPPGTGKTLTAESVAEYTQRPLLSITAADLGHEPDGLEKNLLRYFRRANDWDALVLLDEADVYLEKRSTGDLTRNSIVSVFLRALDYFQGILFLTTNRVGQFDEAFMSRIHLPLGYDKLSDDSRVQIWDNLFQKLQEDHEKYDGSKILYDYMAKEFVTRSTDVTKLQWNGREIRNAFQTAVALAVYDANHNNKGVVPQPEDKHEGPGLIPKVMESHLRQVVSMSSAFRMYMKAAHQGKTDSDVAYIYGNRDDRAPSTPARPGL